MNIAIIGLGLMGGSFALDVKSVISNSIIYGIDSSDLNLSNALELGLIDQAISYGDLFKMDLVLIAIPVSHSLTVTPMVLDKINDDALVFDVGSTKETICEVIKNHPKRSNFLAAHPMAGTEFSGPKAAHKGLYLGRQIFYVNLKKQILK